MTSGSTTRLGPALAYLTATRLVLNSAHRFVYPFLPAIARGLGIPLEQAGLLVSARSLAGLSVPVWVRAAAAGGTRRAVGLGLALYLAGAALAVGARGFGLALAAFVVLGVAKPTYDTGSQAYLSDHTPYTRRARVTAVTELTWAGGFLVGAPLSGWLIARGDWQLPFVVFGALGVVALALLPRLLAPTARLEQPRAAGARFERRTTGVMVVAALFSFGAEVATIVFGVWLEDAFGLSLLALGATATALAVAELVGELGVVAFVDRIGKRRAVLVGMATSAVLFLVWPLVGDSLGLGVGALALALLGFEFTIVSSLPLASELRPQLRARTIAQLYVALNVGRAAAAAIGPAVYGSVGLWGNASLAAGANVLGIVVLLATVDAEPTS